LVDGVNQVSDTIIISGGFDNEFSVDINVSPFALKLRILQWKAVMEGGELE
jgi:hypothetical protein